jgi:hypothetical protein
MIPKDLITQIQITSGFERVPWELACAMAERESAGITWVMRFESRWTWFVEPQKYATKLGISYNTERTLQQFSYGTMQVMGAVARELGYEDYLVKLASDPAMGIQYGCRKLRQLLDKYSSEESAISAYNAGTPFRDDNGNYVNQGYVNAVLELKKQYAAH